MSFDDSSQTRLCVSEIFNSGNVTCPPQRIVKIEKRSVIIYIVFLVLIIAKYLINYLLLPVNRELIDTIMAFSQFISTFCYFTI